MIINEELGHNISGISDEEMLRQLVEKLKNNEKQISRELLQTKYRSSYERLRKDISVTADLIVKDRAWSGIYIQKDLEGEVLVQKIRELAQNSGVKKKIHKTLYVEYDVDRFLQVLDHFSDQVRELWYPYWESRQQKINQIGKTE